MSKSGEISANLVTLLVIEFSQEMLTIHSKNKFQSEDLWRTVAEQRQQICASHFSNPDCRGYLLKLDGVSRTWKRRFCILADACLFVYVDSDSHAAYGNTKRPIYVGSNQRALTVGKFINVRLVSSFTWMDSTQERPIYVLL